MFWSPFSEFKLRFFCSALVIIGLCSCSGGKTDTAQQQSSVGANQQQLDSGNPLQLAAKSASNGWRASVRFITDNDSDPALVGPFLEAEITLADRSGLPLNNAFIQVGGGMPGHGHGLPSTPRITGSPGPGRYHVEGLKFNMPGEWVLSLIVFDGQQQERIDWTFHISH